MTKGEGNITQRYHKARSLKKTVLCAFILLPLPFFGQTKYTDSSFQSLHNSVVASLSCSGPGLLHNKNKKNSLGKVCCAYHTKQAYDSIIATQERMELEEPQKPRTPPGKNETACEKLTACLRKSYSEKQPLIDKLWTNYEEALAKASKAHDEESIKIREGLKAQCYLAWNPQTGITRDANLSGPSITAVTLILAKTKLNLTIDLANKLQKIYEEIDDKCTTLVMGKDLLMPLCNMEEWDLSGLFGTIAELYETIQTLNPVACGQPLKTDDCCTVIPYKH